MLTVNIHENNCVAWDLLQWQFIEKLKDKNVDDNIVYIQNIRSVDGNWKYDEIVKVSKTIRASHTTMQNAILYSAI